MIIALDRVTKTFGERTLFADVSVQVNKGDRYALVGPNGAGKTTLLEIMASIQSPDEGRVNRARGISVGYLEQEAIEMKGKTVLAEVMAAASKVNALEGQLRTLEAEMEAAGSKADESLVGRYGDVHHRYELAGGYDLETDARTVLGGLGFSADEMVRPVEEFSGGWLMRVALARLLVMRPDVLLLDEPTNHLDLESVVWLEGFLREHQGGMVMVSHDRAFLQGLADHIVEIEMGRVSTYTGDYRSYIQQRELALEQLQSAYDKQQREIAHMQKFVDRFRYKNTKSRQAQDRVKKLEKMERIELPQARKGVRFAFPQPARTGDVVVSLDSVAKAYGDNVVYDSLELKLYRGDKVVLVGPNGAGKSTLLKMIAGVLEPDTGERSLGHHVSVAYFAQHQLEALEAKNSALDELWAVAPSWRQEEARRLLGAFLFSGDDVLKKVGVLSGGERCRLALAKMLVEPAPLLCLDEPTNHLDVDASDVLEAAMSNFGGTIVLISHDRHLIRAVANKVVEVRDGGVRVFEGDYDYYLWKREQETGGSQVSTPDAAGDADVPDTGPVPSVRKKSREDKRAEAEARNKAYRTTRKVKNRLAQVEKDLAGLTARAEELEHALADPDHYAQGGTFPDMLSEYADVKERIGALEPEWLSLAEELEHMDASL